MTNKLQVFQCTFLLPPTLEQVLGQYHTLEIHFVYAFKHVRTELHGSVTSLRSQLTCI